MKKIILMIFMLFLLTSCNENATAPLLDQFTQSLFVPMNTEIDGGFFLASTSKNNDSTNPNWIKTRVVLHYKKWPGVVSVFLDDSVIMEYSQRLNISPFQEHTWNVLENQQAGIPRIHKTIPAIQALTISNLHNYDTIARNQTIYWNPSNDTLTKVFILLQEFGREASIDTTKNVLWVIPTQDNGSFTFSSDYLKKFQTGEQIRIDILRVRSEVETYENKKYLFTTLFETYLILFVR